MKKNQYPVKLFKAAIVFQDANGNFVLKKR
ncbi:hypothetical protein Q757_09960 [Oenococcus alcoholitolerans]|uniref:Uncharacterized protein n=1 Tax=Oenococcus alcoholitolerans TaxID=931074 RepID=A0ABR4XNJ8_9LACO|nr:hypothetical protein Q757_09960 [Oenococcus alcoholitolerans]